MVAQIAAKQQVYVQENTSKANYLVHTLHTEFAATIKGPANGITVLTKGNCLSNGNQVKPGKHKSVGDPSPESDHKISSIPDISSANIILIGNNIQFPKLGSKTSHQTNDPPKYLMDLPSPTFHLIPSMAALLAHSTPFQNGEPQASGQKKMLDLLVLYL